MASALYVVSPQDKKGQVHEKTIRDLIKQLGDESFEKREAADKALAAMGATAHELLRDAAKQHADVEVRNRAAELVRSYFTINEVRRFEGHTRVNSPYVHRVAVTPDGRFIVSSGDDALRLWEVATGKLVLTFAPAKANLHYMSLAVTPDGKRVVAGCNDKSIRVFDLKTGEQVQELSGHTSAVWGVALSADGKQLVSGSYAMAPLHLWNMENGTEIRVLQGVVGNIRSVAYRSPNGKLAATAETCSGPMAQRSCTFGTSPTANLSTR